MRILTRPIHSRLITGVASGISEVYGMPVTLVRLLFIAGFLAQPIVLLLYLLLAISIQSEDAVVSGLQLAEDSLLSPRERFEKLSDVLVKRLSGRRTRISSHTVAFATVLLAAAFEIPRLEGINFYSAHPIISALASTVSRFGSVLLDVTLAMAFLLGLHRAPSNIILRLKESERLILEEGRLKSVGGLAVAIARVIRIDPAYIRVSFILLNLLTFGVAGVIYLVVVVVFRRKGGGIKNAITASANNASDPYRVFEFRWVVAFLFLALALLRVSTEFRFFFFNEPFFQGIAFIIIGLLFALRGLSSGKSTSSLWLIGGAAVLLMGVEDFCTAVFQVQLTLPARFEVTYAISALALIYYSLIELNARTRRTAIMLVVMFLCAPLMIELHVLPARFLLALVQFYDFFYPLIFAGLGLWLVMER
jgi:phage shock protein PspC (stress-responsive transcriptional regulator)